MTPSATSDQLMSPRPKHPISDKPDDENKSPTQNKGNGDESDDTGIETDTSNDEAKKSDEEDEQMHETATTSTPSPSNESATKDKDDYYSIEEQRRMIAKLRIVLNGRNILDLGANLNLKSTSSSESTTAFVASAELPTNNLKMFLANRSQYHRLGANGHIQEYALAKCTCCDLIYPVNGYGNNTFSNTYGSANVMTNDARPAEENSLSSGVLAYLKSATVCATNTVAPVPTAAPTPTNSDLFGGSDAGFGAGFGMRFNNSYHNEYNGYFGNGTTNPMAAAANKYNSSNNYPQPAATVVNALLNTKEPNFNNTNINYSISNGKNLYNANNLNNMTALNRILNGGTNNPAAAAAAAAVAAAAFNGNGSINAVAGNQNSIESLAAALLSQNLINVATAAAAVAAGNVTSCNNNNNNGNKYHPIHNQHHNSHLHHNQHHKMSPPQNNYGYYKQF